MDLPELARLQARIDLSPEPARTLEALGLDESTWRTQQEAHLTELADALDRGESEPLERFTAAYEAAKRELSGLPPSQAAAPARAATPAPAQSPIPAPTPPPQAAPAPVASLAEDDTARLPAPFVAQAPAPQLAERGAPTAFVPSRVAEVDETAALPSPFALPPQRRVAELAATAALPPAPTASTPQARGQVEPARPGQRFTASPSQGFAPPPKAGPAFLEPRPSAERPSPQQPSAAHVRVSPRAASQPPAALPKGAVEPARPNQRATMAVSDPAAMRAMLPKRNRALPDATVAPSEVRGPAMPFAPAAPSELIPLERYAAITTELERGGDPIATFTRLGFTPDTWMAQVRGYTRLFDADPSAKARFDALKGKHHG